MTNKRQLTYDEKMQLKVIRLVLVESSTHFTTCKCCDFQFIPFTESTECPKCDMDVELPIDLQQYKDVA